MVKKLYNYYISKDKDLARHFKQIVGFTPKNMRVFKQAFYHKSMNGKADSKNYISNERLEYLGDSILSSVVAEYLYKKYPVHDEGFLTKMRSKIVKRKTLNDVADKMGLDVILSKYSNGHVSNSMLGNALEALIGAVYLEFGYDNTRDYIIQNILMKYLDIHTLESLDENYKSQLLEWGQKNGSDVEFKLVSKYKHDKRDRFKVAVMVDGKTMANAEAFNKKSAEQSASSKVLTKMEINA